MILLGCLRDYKEAPSNKFNELRSIFWNFGLDAQYNLGWMYANGDGVERNEEEAAKWFRMAADQGDMEAYKALWKMKK